MGQRRATNEEKNSQDEQTRQQLTLHSGDLLDIRDGAFKAHLPANASIRARSVIRSALGITHHVYVQRPAAKRRICSPPATVKVTAILSFSFVLRT